MEETWGGASHVGCSKRAGCVGLGRSKRASPFPPDLPVTSQLHDGLVVGFSFCLFAYICFFNNYLAVFKLKHVHIIAMMLKCSYNN